MTTPNLAAHNKGVALYGWTGTEFLPVSIDSSGNLVVGATLSLSGDLNVDTKALANAAAPTLVEGTQNFFSADLAGNLRVKDAAAGTVLASILAKLLAAPATEAKQDTTNSKLDVLHVDLATTLAAYVDGLETLVGTTNSGLTTLNAKDFATQTTLAAVLAKLIAAPATEAKQDAAIVQETASAAALGTTAGAAVVTDANGTVQQYLRGLVKRWVDALGAGTAAAALRTTLASDDPAVATLGATTGAKVVTDANGTLQQYLRGLVTFFANALGTGTAAAANRTVEAGASTGTQSIVASSATDVTVLAANAARLGATIFNDSTAILYLLLASGTSSNTLYSVQIAAGGYYEVPFRYAGVIKGIWASANGNARVTELT